MFPRLNVKSTLAFWFNCSKIPERSATWNPGFSARTSYRPIGRRGRIYDPALFVVVGHVVPRSKSFAVTFAPAIGLPVGSVTMPFIAALTSCAWRRTDAIAERASNAARTPLRIRVFNAEILNPINLPPVE